MPELIAISIVGGIASLPRECSRRVPKGETPASFAALELPPDLHLRPPLLTKRAGHQWTDDSWNRWAATRAQSEPASGASGTGAPEVT